MINKKYSYILIIFGILGFLASFLLTIDTMKVLENPGVQLPCNINPFISCTSVATSPQGKIFGFANPLLGIAGFSAVITIGLITLLGAVPNKRFNKLILLGTTLSFILNIWFIYQSLFVLGTLCIYCMTTWVAIAPIFLYTIKNNFEIIFLNKNHLPILIAWYLVIIFLILFRFKDFFLY